MRFPADFLWILGTNVCGAFTWGCQKRPPLPIWMDSILPQQGSIFRVYWPRLPLCLWPSSEVEWTAGSHQWVLSGWHPKPWWSPPSPSSLLGRWVSTSQRCSPAPKDLRRESKIRLESHSFYLFRFAFDYAGSFLNWDAIGVHFKASVVVHVSWLDTT